MNEWKTWIAALLLGLLALVPWATNKASDESPETPTTVANDQQPGDEVHGYLDPSG